MEFFAPWHGHVVLHVVFLIFFSVVKNRIELQLQLGKTYCIFLKPYFGTVQHHLSGPE
jgi:hypothetical protein